MAKNLGIDPKDETNDPVWEWADKQEPMRSRGVLDILDKSGLD